MAPKAKSGDANNSRKRKMKEVVAETAEPIPTPLPLPLPPVRYFPLHNQSHFPSQLSNAFSLDLNTQPNPPNFLHENINVFSPFKSFTSLLTGVDYHDSLPPIVKEQNAQVDQLITAQGDQLKRTLGDIQRRQYSLLTYEAEERATKRLKEKELEVNEMRRRNAELERKELMREKENQMLQNKVKYLEQTTASLRAQLQESIMLGGKLECGGCSDDGRQRLREQEDVESAHVDPQRMEPIMLACKACGKRTATVMMWPCRHVCACKSCDSFVKACPVCSVTKTTSVEVCLP